VVLVHGYPDSRAVWSLVIPLLEPHFHVVAYDVRGAGESDAPAGTAGYDLELLAADARAVLDAVAPDRRVHLVGHDWGSIAGWELVTSPLLAGRFASFTSMCGPSLDHVGLWIRRNLRHPRPRGLLAMAGQARRSWYMAGLRIPGAERVPGMLAGRWPRVLTEREGARVDESYPPPTFARDAANGAGLYRRNVARRLRRPRRHPPIEIPVQLIVPEADRFASERLYDDLESHAPNLLRRSIPGGHWVPRTHPERLVELIAGFVDGVERAAQVAAAASA